MALDLGTMYAKVELDRRDYQQGMKEIPQQAQTAFKRVASLAGTYLTARAIFGFVREGVNEFSILQEACNKFDAVFGKIPHTAAQVEKELRNTFKLSEQTSRNMLSGIADQLQAFGMSAEKSLSMARRAAERGIDLASFKGGSQQDAVDSIAAALTGETERMKRYGVVINQGTAAFNDRVKAIRQATGATEQMAKAEAIMAMILEQSKNAAGDYLRPGATIAQTKMDIAENTRKATAAMGEELAKGVHPLLQGYNELLTKFNELDPASRRLTMNLAGLTGGLALLKTDTGKSLNKGIANALKALLSAGNGPDVKKQEEERVRQVQQAEEQQELIQRQAAARRELLEAKRHQVELQNRLKEQAAAVRAAEAKVAAEAKAARETAISETTAAQAVVVAEKTKELAAARSSATRIALENRRHQAEVKNQLEMQAFILRSAQNRLSSLQSSGAPKAEIRSQSSTVAAESRAYDSLARSMNQANKAAEESLAKAKAARAAEIAGIETVKQRSAAEIAKAGNTAKASAASVAALRQEQAALASLRTQAHQAALAVDAKRAASLDAAAAASMNATATRTQYAMTTALNVAMRPASGLLAGIAGGLRAAGVAAKGFLASLGPLGWAMLAFSVVQAIFDKIGASEEKAAAKAREAAQAAAAAVEQNDQSNRKAAEAMTRLQELASFDRLNGSEMSEARRLMDELGLSYEKDGVRIDEHNRKLVAEKKSLAELIKQRKEQLRLDRIRALYAEKKANEAALVNKESAHEDNKRLINRNREIDAEMLRLYRGEDDPGETKDEKNKKEHQQSEAQRRELEQLKAARDNIRFNAASDDPAEQIRLLDEQLAKLREIQRESVGNRKEADYTEEELKRQREIVELEAKRAELRKQSAKSFEEERRNDEKYRRERAEKQQDKQLDRQLNRLEREGDRESAGRLIQNQLKAAREQASRLREEYAWIVADAESDGNLTAEEQRRIDAARENMRKAEENEERWSDRAYDHEQGDKKERETTGSWSAALLQAMLGPSKPEEETAKYTKKNYEETRKLNEKMTGQQEEKYTE